MNLLSVKGKKMDNSKTKVILITTGGTIDKTYDESEGTLENRDSLIRQAIVGRLRLPYTELEVFSIMSKDSLYMTDEDRALICMYMKNQLGRNVPIVVLHGTDTMTHTAEYCLEHIGEVNVPVVFTGAMKPLGFSDSDAQQNVTEALLAAKLLKPGFYVSFHNRIFNVPNVKKNKDKRTFEEV